MSEGRANTIHPWECRIYVDTEFSDIANPQLVSLGMVSEDGREFYGEVRDIFPDDCSLFVRKHVLPQLGARPECVMSRPCLGVAARSWMKGFDAQSRRPVLCFDHPLDAQLLWALIGGRPVGWKEKLISQRIDAELRERYFLANGGRHHALHDARANMMACR